MKSIVFISLIMSISLLNTIGEFKTLKTDQLADYKYQESLTDSSRVIQEEDQIVTDLNEPETENKDFLIQTEKFNWYNFRSKRLKKKGFGPIEIKEPEQDSTFGDHENEAQPVMNLKEKNYNNTIIFLNEYVIAKLYLLKQIGDNITDELGKKLNLDVVELSGGKIWKSNSILFGKNITRKLILSYQRKLPVGDSKKIPTDKFALEYRFNNLFSVLATHDTDTYTGLNLFWKFGRK